MTTILDTYGSVLFGKLCPLDSLARAEEIMEKRDKEEEVEVGLFQEYQITFVSPFDPTTANYKSILDLCGNKIEQKLYNTLNTESESKKINLLNSLLESVDNYLKRYVDIHDSFLRSVEKKAMEMEQKNICVYVLNYLKLHLMKLYLEVQTLLSQFQDRFCYSFPNLEQKYFKKEFVIPMDKVGIAPSKTVTTTASTQPPSFKYLKFNRENSNLTDLCNYLKGKKLIAQNTTSNQFKFIFAGKQIRKPIIWTGTKTELAYFIRLLISKEGILEEVKQQQWKITSFCFCHPTGELFDRKEFRSLKAPVNTYILEKAVKLL